MKALGIDPGYGRLGWAIGDIDHRKLKLETYGCIETSPQKKLGERYQQIVEELVTICKQYQPETLAIEKLYFSKNTTTALKVSESRGLVFAAVTPHLDHILEFGPSEIKLAVTGNGNANKAAVKKMTLLQTNLTNKPKILDDTVDAIAVLLTLAVSQPALLDDDSHVIL